MLQEIDIKINSPAHPGEILREYMPENLNATNAAKHLGIARALLSRILNSKAGVTAEMDLLLSGALDT